MKIASSIISLSIFLYLLTLSSLASKPQQTDLICSDSLFHIAGAAALPLKKSGPQPLKEDPKRFRHFWELEGAPPDEAFILFRQDPAKREILVHDHRGLRSVPGAGAFLLEELRKSFPDHSIDGAFGFLQFNRAREAFLDDPDDPNLKQIPIFKKLRGRVTVGPDLDLIDGLDAGSILISIQPLSETPHPVDKLVWLNRDQLLNHPFYRLWIKLLALENPETESPDPSTEREDED